jgi:hypothetical protein
MNMETAQAQPRLGGEIDEIVARSSLRADRTGLYGPRGREDALLESDRQHHCDNDPDKSVDADERLSLVDVAPGTYDVSLKDKTGRSCKVANVEVKAGGPYAFSIEEEQLKGCKK